MSVWTYSDRIEERGIIASAIHLQECPFCSSVVEQLADGRESLAPGSNLDLTVTTTVRACSLCGWWVSVREELSTIDIGGGKKICPRLGPHERRVFGAVACLRLLDLTDISVPVEEVQDYLTAKFEARNEVNPQLMEKVVGSVFHDLGYEVTVTAYSNDGGIDAVLADSKGCQIGVQVKRWKGKIKVEQIRSFAGALFVNGLTRGIFVTTSTFQSGAQGVANLSAMRGIPIELVDARRLYEALKIVRRKRFITSGDKGAPYLNPPMTLISSESHPLFETEFKRLMHWEVDAGTAAPLGLRKPGRPDNFR